MSDTDPTWYLISLFEEDLFPGTETGTSELCLFFPVRISDELPLPFSASSLFLSKKKKKNSFCEAGMILTPEDKRTTKEVHRVS